MMALHPVLQEQYEASIGRGFAVDFGGTAMVWRRDGWGLSWAGERQTLPSGSTPLRVLDGPVIEGRGWTAAEIALFSEITGAAVVYEFALGEQ